jgi:hypothetical protein
MNEVSHHLGNDSSSFHPVHSLIRAVGPPDLHHPKGRGLHPHAHRRLWLKGSSSWFLLSLSEACCAHSLHRLGELVDQELFDRQAAAPPVALDPEIEKLLPY